jgi:hypothetical protein
MKLNIGNLLILSIVTFNFCTSWAMTKETKSIDHEITKSSKISLAGSWETMRTDENNKPIKTFDFNVDGISYNMTFYHHFNATANKVYTTEKENVSLKTELKKEKELTISLKHEINDLKETQLNNLKSIEKLIEENKKYKSGEPVKEERLEIISEIKSKSKCSNSTDRTNIADLTNQTKQLARIKTAGFWLFGTSTAASLGAAAFIAITKNPNVVFNLFGFSTKHSMPVIATGFTTLGLSSLLIGWRCGFFSSKK